MDAAMTTVAAPGRLIAARCGFCQEPVAPEQKFCGACGAVLSIRCERKQATVLLLDVCGFTAMSERLDPEDVRAIMDRAFDVMLDRVHAHGGSVNQFLGDGVMALFGEIDGVEGHAIRALCAAVEIQNDLAALRDEVRRDHDVEFRVRAGLHTGPVTMGAIAHGSRTDYVSRGETTNIATRLTNMARGQQIFVSQRTRELAMGAFVFVAVDDILANSDTLPISAWLVAFESCDRVDAELGLLAEV